MFHEHLGFELLPSDRIFLDSPDAGDPACLCSRCGKFIDENDVPIRVTDSVGITERRYHLNFLTTGGIMRPISFDVQPPAIVAPGEWSEVLFGSGDRGHAWDINRANLILRDAMLHLRSMRRIFALPISAENQQAFLNGALTAHGRDCENMPPVDPNVPILLVQLGGRHFVIDGLSRARHAIFLGWDAMPAYLLTRYEEYCCRICPCCCAENRLSQVVREAREARALQAC